MSLTEKERMELLNLRKRVETQREEIKKLSEQLARRKEYIEKLESLFEDAIEHLDLDGYHHYEAAFQELIHTA